MSSPQEPARRHRQKIRRSKQLAAWKTKHPTKAQPEAEKAKAAKPAAAKKPAAPDSKAAAKVAAKK
jgi:hypothetical protein